MSIDQLQMGMSPHNNHALLNAKQRIKGTLYGKFQGAYYSTALNNGFKMGTVHEHRLRKTNDQPILSS